MDNITADDTAAGADASAVAGAGAWNRYPNGDAISGTGAVPTADVLNEETAAVVTTAGAETKSEAQSSSSPASAAG